MNSQKLKFIRLLACLAFIASQPAYGAGNPNGSNGKTNNGNTFDCSKSPQLCTGNNGNGVGNLGPGNQGNDGTNGNTGPGVGNGGSNNGGSNNGGSNNGGSNNGGSNNGGSNNGGSNNGGGNNGGGNNGGGTTGGGETPTETTQPVAPAEKETKRTLKAKIEPLFYMDQDFGMGIIAVEKDSRRSGITGSALQMTQAASQYQKFTYELLEGGMGAAINFHFKNATGIASHWWAQVGLMPMKGTEISSVRYAKTLAEAKAMKGYTKAPTDLTSIYQWQVGDSVAYKSKGGVIFVAGTGFGPAAISTTKIAQGSWETYVERVSNEQVYVKITNSKLDALSLGAGAALAAVGVNQFKNADDGFSYLFDLRSEDARKAYADLVNGNVAAAQTLSSPAIVKVENFKRISKGKGFSLFFGVPILLNSTSSENKIESVTATDMHIENTKVDAQFGIYDFTVQTRAFGAHTVSSKGFYGARYNLSDLRTSEIKDKGEFGRFTWIFQDDHTSTRSLQQSLSTLIVDTGLDQLRVNLPQNTNEMGFTNMTLNMTLSTANTLSLIQKAIQTSNTDFAQWAEKRAKQAWDQKGAALCKQTSEHDTSCEAEMINAAVHAAEQMQKALINMNSARSDSVEYTKAYAEFGKAAMTNQITLGMVFSLVGRGAEITFAIEGTYFKPHTVSFVSADDGNLELIKLPAQMDGSLDPKNKRSRFHGLITNKNLTGLGAPL